MTTAPPAPPAQTAQAPPPPSQQPLFLPGQQLTPTPDRDRPWRVLTVLLGSAVVLLLISGLTLATAASWATGRGYSEVAATTGLGTPTSLSLTSEVGSVRVLPSEDVDEVTLALVEPGATALPPPQETVRARITRGTDSQGATAVVSQPQRYSVLPWMNPHPRPAAARPRRPRAVPRPARRGRQRHGRRRVRHAQRARRCG